VAATKKTRLWSFYARLTGHNCWAILTALAVTNVAFSEASLSVSESSSTRFFSPAMEVDGQYRFAVEGVSENVA